MGSKGKVVVTGGSGGLGVSVAKVFVAHGYDVHATARSSDREAGPGEGVTLHQIDVGNEEELARGLEEVGGPLAALVATVGGFTFGPIASLTAAEIDRVASLNLKTVLLTLKVCYPYLKESAGGAGVVLVSSRGAITGGAGTALYAATKAAVANLALSAAQEWLEDGISVNAVLPSIMDTPQNRRDMPDADFSRWPTTDQVAEVIAFLVGEQARIVSGGAIPVYGRA